MRWDRRRDGLAGDATNSERRNNTRLCLMTKYDEPNQQCRDEYDNLTGCDLNTGSHAEFSQILMNRRQSNGERVSVTKPRRQGRVQKLVAAPTRKIRIQRGNKKEAVANTHKKHEE